MSQAVLATNQSELVSHEHTETSRHSVEETIGPKRSSNSIEEIDGKKFEVTTTEQTSQRRSSSATTSTDTFVRQRRSSALLMLTLSNDDLLSIESYDAILKQKPPTTSKVVLRTDKDELTKETKRITEALNIHLTALEEISQDEGQLTEFCSAALSDILYSETLRIELEQAGVADAVLISNLKMATKRIVNRFNQQIKYIKAMDPAAITVRPVKQNVRNINNSLKEIARMISVAREIEDVMAIEQYAQELQELEILLKKLKKALHSYHKEQTESMLDKTAKYFDEKQELVEAYQYGMAHVDELTGYKTNFSYQIGIFASNLSQFALNSPKLCKAKGIEGPRVVSPLVTEIVKEAPKESVEETVEEPVEEVEAKEETKVEAEAIREEAIKEKPKVTIAMPSLAPREEQAAPAGEQKRKPLGEERRAQDDGPLGLKESKRSPSTDALIKRAHERERLSLSSKSQSVSLFMIQQKRVPILLEPTKENALIRSPTCPHVTFDFTHEGPIDDEEPAEESPLVQLPPSHSDEDVADVLQEDLLPNLPRAPFFAAWHPLSVTTVPRTPSVSLDKLKSMSARTSKLKSSNARLGSAAMFQTGSATRLSNGSTGQLQVPLPTKPLPPKPQGVHTQKIPLGMNPAARFTMGSTAKFTMGSTSRFGSAAMALTYDNMRIRKVDQVEDAPPANEQDAAEAPEIDTRMKAFSTELDGIEGTSQRMLFFAIHATEFEDAALCARSLLNEDSTNSTAVSIKSTISHLSDECNRCIDVLIGAQWEPPRKSVVRALNMIEIIIAGLDYVEENTKDMKERGLSAESIRDWRRYFTDVCESFRTLVRADDNVAVVSSLKFLVDVRTGFASFNSLAERLDAEMKSTILILSQRQLLATMDTITAFIKTAELTELVTPPNVISSLEGVRQKFQQASRGAPIPFRSLAHTVESTLNTTIAEINTVKVETCDADRYSQQLRDITNRAETVMEKNTESKNFELMREFHEYATAARFSLLHMHVPDSEKEAELCRLLAQNVTEFSALQKCFADHAKSDRESTAELAKAWQRAIGLLNQSFIDLDAVSDVMNRNPSRYDSAREYLEQTSRRLQTIENKRFGHYIKCSAQFTKAATSLQDTLNYCIDTPNKLRRRGQEPMTSATNDINLKQIVESNSALSSSTVDLSAYEKGFIDPDTVKRLREELQEANSDNKGETIYDKISLELSGLFAAQIDALARNYNISTKSTTVLYSLITTYAASIIEVAPLVEETIITKNIAELHANVEKSKERLNAIQATLDGKAVFSDFAQKRLLIFAQMCQVFGDVTELNIHHLLGDEGTFNDTQINTDMRRLSPLCAFFPKFKVANSTLALKDLIRVSRAQKDSNNPFELQPVLTNETKLMSRMMDLANNFNSEQDVRFFRLDPELIPVFDQSIADVRAPHQQIEKGTPTAVVKRSLDVVSDNFQEYSTMLNSGDYNGDKLVTLSSELSKSVRFFTESALSVENGTESFFQFVYDLEHSYAELLDTLKTHSSIGSQRLFSLQAKQSLARVRLSIARTSRRLALMEQLESTECKESNQQALEVTLGILTRTAKLLYIARDELQAEVEKHAEIPAPTKEMSSAVSNSYESVASVLLSVKTKVQASSIKTRAEELRPLVWGAQDLLDAGDFILQDVRASGQDDVESIEFWILAALEPMIEAMGETASSIPSSVPDAAALRRKVYITHKKLQICTTPYQEGRTFRT